MQITANWIPVLEQEPPDGVIVLVIGEQGYAETPSVTAAIYNAAEQDFTDAFAHDRRGERWCPVWKVTHWMPLDGLMPQLAAAQEVKETQEKYPEYEQESLQSEKAEKDPQGR
jgi:hypothetical protein